jgi:hypothetical protein
MPFLPAVIQLIEQLLAEWQQGSRTTAVAILARWQRGRFLWFLT